MPFITQGKINVKYILIVVILAVIVGGGILGYYYSWIADLDTRLAQLETRPLEVKAPEEVFVDETVNWKTYKNEEYGYEVKYPETWPNPKHLEEFEEIVEFVSEDYQKPGAELLSGMSVAIGFSRLLKDETWEELIEEWEKFVEVKEGFSKGFTLIKGRRIHETIYENPLTSEYWQLIQFPNPEGELIFDLQFTILKKDKEKHSKIVNQILSTFKFLD